MKDEQIIEWFWLRNEEALAQTDAQYGTYCYTIAYQILGNHDDADECVNDTYQRAWMAIPPAKPQNLRTYLGKITRHLAFDRYKRMHTHKRGEGQLPMILEELSECVSGETEHDPVADKLVLKDCIDRFLKTLSPTKRQLFMRRYWYGDSIAELAVTFHKSENDVYVTLCRLRAALKIMLEKEGMGL